MNTDSPEPHELGRQIRRLARDLNLAALAAETAAGASRVLQAVGA